ncbi:ABC transporter permease [Bifidobacterium sp. ESL0775]|uniref:FtsX-like permease family protein n=1 Tax=Bifidobacterium sp. ESL0775 TaxID=2983230 RepID=UPI0023F6369D|nr:ABC transporter permease [Bifidobacterium sp. ESL0775]WEV69261.1 ABC transporter permease [Bifidobacterium sp. ESL0775]
MMMLFVAAVMIFGVVFGTAVDSANGKAHGETYEMQAPIAVIRPTAEMKGKLKGDDAASVKKYLSFDEYATYAMGLQQIGVQQPQFSISVSLPMRQAGGTKAIAGKSDESAKKTGGETMLYSLYDNDAISINLMGNFKLAQGKALNYQSKDSKSALVSEAFARKNNLKVGSTFKLGNPTDNTKTYTFKVRGIYAYTDPAPAGNGSDAKLAKDNRDNAVYAGPAAFTKNNLATEKASGWATPRFDVGFKLQGVDQYKSFAEMAKMMKLPKGYEVSSPTLDRYNDLLKPLDTLASVMGKVRVGLYAGGGVILLLLVGLGLRRRTDEIRMDMIIGVTRGRLGWQFALETLMPTLPGLLIGGVAGALAAKPLGSSLTHGIATPAVSACWMAMWYCIAIVAALAVIAFLRATFTNLSRIFDVRSANDDAITFDGKSSDSDNSSQIAIDGEDQAEAQAVSDGDSDDANNDNDDHNDHAAEDDTEVEA